MHVQDLVTCTFGRLGMWRPVSTVLGCPARVAGSTLHAKHETPYTLSTPRPARKTHTIMHVKHAVPYSCIKYGCARAARVLGPGCATGLGLQEVAGWWINGSSLLAGPCSPSSLLHSSLMTIPTLKAQPHPLLPPDTPRTDRGEVH